MAENKAISGFRKGCKCLIRLYFEACRSFGLYTFLGIDVQRNIHRYVQHVARPVRTPHPASDELYRAHSRRGVAPEQALLVVTRCIDGGFQRCETRIDPKIRVAIFAP
jgi:hypothetical protein